MAHEARGGLSSTALLFAQAGILALATATAAALAAESSTAHGQSRAVKGAVMGCGAMVWGASVLGFGRAAVVWAVEGRGRDEEEEEEEAEARRAEVRYYGTFRDGRIDELGGG